MGFYCKIEINSDYLSCTASLIPKLCLAFNFFFITILPKPWMDQRQIKTHEKCSAKETGHHIFARATRDEYTRMRFGMSKWMQTNNLATETVYGKNQTENYFQVSFYFHSFVISLSEACKKGLIVSKTSGSFRLMEKKLLALAGSLVTIFVVGLVMLTFLLFTNHQVERLDLYGTKYFKQNMWLLHCCYCHE